MPLLTGSRGVVLRSARSFSFFGGPQTVFTGGDIGWFHDFDTSKMTMNTETNGSGSVPTAGQPIRRMVSLGPTSDVFTNTNAWNYQTGSYPYMETSNNQAEGQSGYPNLLANNSTSTIIVAARLWNNVDGNKTLIRLWQSSGAEFGIYDFSNTLRKINLFTDRGSVEPATAYVNQDLVITGVANWAAGNISLRINGTEVASGSLTPGVLNGNTMNAVYYGWGATTNGGNRVYASFFVNRALSTVDRDNIEAWMKSRAGIP